MSSRTQLKTTSPRNLGLRTNEKPASEPGGLCSALWTEVPRTFPVGALPLIFYVPDRRWKPTQGVRGPNNARPLPGAVGHLVTAKNGICVSGLRFLNGPSFVLTYDRGNGNKRVGVMDWRTRVQPAVELHQEMQILYSCSFWCWCKKYRKNQTASSVCGCDGCEGNNRWTIQSLSAELLNIEPVSKRHNIVMWLLYFVQ